MAFIIIGITFSKIVTVLVMRILEGLWGTVNFKEINIMVREDIDQDGEVIYPVLNLLYVNSH